MCFFHNSVVLKHFGVSISNICSLACLGLKNKLKLQEKKKGFIEAVKDKKGNLRDFFDLGPDNDWKKILDKKTVNLIEHSFEKEMTELGYL